MDSIIMQQIGLALTLSPRSCQAIQRALVAAGFGGDGGGLRITARRGRDGVVYQFSVEAQGTASDYVVEQHGARVFVDPFWAELLDGGAVDFVATGEDHAFTLTPPRQAGRWHPQLVA